MPNIHPSSRNEDKKKRHPDMNVGVFFSCMNGPHFDLSIRRSELLIICL
jgi:hypothetical protein